MGMDNPQVEPVMQWGATKRPRGSWGSTQFNEKVTQSSSEVELVGMNGPLARYNGQRVAVELMGANKYLARTQEGREFLIARNKLSLVVRQDRSSFLMHKLRSNFSNKDAKIIFQALCLRTRDAIRSHMKKTGSNYHRTVKDLRNLFDLDHNGSIDCTEFCIGMKRLLDGGEEDEEDHVKILNQYKLIYEVWDAANLGSIDLDHFFEVCYNHRKQGELVRKLAVFTEIQRKLRIAKHLSESGKQSGNASGFAVRRAQLSKYRSTIKNPAWAKHVPNDGIHIRYGKMKLSKPKPTTTDKHFRRYMRHNQSHNLSLPKHGMPKTRPMSAMHSRSASSIGGSPMYRPVSAPARIPSPKTFGFQLQTPPKRRVAWDV
jgi:Ca2+-binding EF-hand superfamily protein